MLRECSNKHEQKGLKEASISGKPDIISTLQNFYYICLFLPTGISMTDTFDNPIWTCS